MSSGEFVKRKVFWYGLLLNIGFRLFAYGLLSLVFYFISSRSPIFGNWSRVIGSLKILTDDAVVVSLPLALTFVAGFLSAYFWRKLELREYMTGVWWSECFFFVLVVGALVNTERVEYIGFEMVFGFLNVILCLMGAATGCDFWKSRLGRQLFGDFSTREPVEYYNCFESTRRN